MQLNRNGFTFLEVLAVMLIIGIIAGMSLGLVKQKGYKTMQGATEVYNDMKRIAEYYIRRRSCSPTVPAGYPSANPLNNSPYQVSCLREGVAVTTVLPAEYNKEFSYRAGVSVVGNRLIFYEQGRMIGDGGFEKKHYYNQ